MPVNKVILVDVDDTLLNWREGFFAYAASHNQYPMPGSEDQFIMSNVFDMCREEADDFVTSFNGGHWRFGALSALDDAKTVLTNLNKNYGYRFVAISSCLNKPMVLALRKVNLYHTFGDIFDDVFCLDYNEKKEDYLSQHAPTIWVDDRSEQANAGIKTGHKTFLLNKPWNEHVDVHEDVIRCNDWFEIQEYILKGE